MSLTLLGAYYAVLGASTLLHLSDVTWRWIHLSNDADFRLDYQVFTLWIGTGAVLALAFGLTSVTCGLGTLSGRPWSSRYWGGLAIAAPLLHCPWLFYRVIATGRTPRAEAAGTIRLFAIRCAVICAAYALAWVLARRRVAIVTSASTR